MQQRNKLRPQDAAAVFCLKKPKNQTKIIFFSPYCNDSLKAFKDKIKGD